MRATGGAAPYTITDPTTGAVRSVTWNAPALNTVFYRFSEEEVRFILVYGRQFSPMSPWGIAGGGPMNEQQIDSIIAYLKSIQLPADACEAGVNFCEGGRLPADKQAEIQAGHRRRPSRAATPAASGRPSSTSPSTRRLLLRPLPHLGLVLRQPAGDRRRCVRAEPHERRRGAPVPERGRQPGLRPQPTRAGQEVRAAGPVERPHARLRRRTTPRRSWPSSIEYIRSL